MPNPNKTHVTFLLDRSGSMASVRADVIGGFNQLLADQQKLPGQCTVTIVQFDSHNPYDILRDFVPVADIKPLGDEYKPRGNTPLYDAVGRGIVNLGERLAALLEHERPGRVLFVIVTDGLENWSKEYRADQIKRMIEHQQSAYSWDFMYLGTNHDAMLAAGQIGIQLANAANYGEVRTAGGVLNAKMRAYRSAASPAAAKMSNLFTPDERAELEAK